MTINNTLVAFDVISDQWFINYQGEWAPLNVRYWPIYKKEGTLDTILLQLKENGYKVDPCWNKWEYWSLDIEKEEALSIDAKLSIDRNASSVEEEFDIDIVEESPRWSLHQTSHIEPHPELYTRPTIWLYGTPGIEPSIEEKEQAIHELADKKEKEEEDNKAYIQAIEEQNKPLKEALKGLVRSTVLEFNEEDNFIIIRTTEGKIIKITSSHRVWNYGCDSDDSLEFYLIDKQP